jgi:hypothetical protein
MATVRAQEVDSYFYSFSYRLGCEADLPVDFPIPDSAAGFQAGVFLPRADPDWLGRSRYPPRILLLHAGSLVVLTHPRRGAEPLRLALSDVTFIEAGELFLIGWLRLLGSGFDFQLPYNTRSHHVMKEFLDALMAAYLLGNGTDSSPDEIAEFGPPLDIKFQNLLAANLQPGERLCARWFRPASEPPRRWWRFRIRAKVGGDLLALTNKRLIWLRDRRDDHYERYGRIVTTAHLRGVERVQCGMGQRSGELTVPFYSGPSWRIPLFPGSFSDAEAFAKAFQR